MSRQRWVIAVNAAEERHRYAGDTVYSVWTDSLTDCPDDDGAIWVHVPGEGPAPSGLCVVELHPGFWMVPEYRLVDRLDGGVGEVRWP